MHSSLKKIRSLVEFFLTVCTPGHPLPLTASRVRMQRSTESLFFIKQKQLTHKNIHSYEAHPVTNPPVSVRTGLSWLLLFVVCLSVLIKLLSPYQAVISLGISFGMRLLDTKTLNFGH